MSTEFRTDWETTSFSELSTLAACEEKWYRRYVLREPTESGPASIKGTLFHEGSGALLMGGTVEDAHIAMAAAVVEERADLEDEKIRQAIEDATWLVDRYARHYAVQLRRVKVVAHELAVERVLHYPTRDGMRSVRVKGKLDSLLDIDGKLWLREAKSSGRRDILETTLVAPQITLYWWLLEEYHLNGAPVELYGVLFDFAYTYRWKLQKPTQKELIEAEMEQVAKSDFPGYRAPWNEMPWLGEDPAESKRKTAWARQAVANHPGIEAHADSESFEQQWLDRTSAQVDAGLQWAQNILERRYALTQSLPERPPTVRNIGPSCKFCDHKANCYGEMAFPQDDIVLDLS